MFDMFIFNFDFIFYFFYVNIDCFWVKWQVVNFIVCQYDILNFIVLCGVIQMWFNFFVGNVMFDYQFLLFKVGDFLIVIMVGQIMNIKGKGVLFVFGKFNGILCYEYVE